MKEPGRCLGPAPGDWPEPPGGGRIRSWNRTGGRSIITGRGDPSLAEAWKAEARRLGFELVGITTADPPDHVDIYQAWIEAGRHATMGYLASERALSHRSDLRRVLAECASVLVVGLRYPPPARDGPIAAYACAPDYHEVIPGRLRKLVAWLEAQLGTPLPHRIYTDSGPILERELGQRSGLGWIGKNTCLIHPHLGSFFLLGEILLAKALPPDPPMTDDRCGHCTRCLQACPTGCILPDRTIDSSRCLSYLTIELRGSLPPPLRPSLGPWVFGCDICQRVCPWNERFASPPAPGAWRSSTDLEDLTARDLLEASPQQLRAWMRGTPLERARRRGLLRNAAVVAGNSADRTHAASLAHMLDSDPEPGVRAHAAWALGRLGGDEARAALARARHSETDLEVLEEIRSGEQAARS